MHSVLFVGGDSVEWGAVMIGFAVFDFGEVNVVVLNTDEVDFVEVGFVVSGYDGVAVLFEVGRDAIFGFTSDVGGVFLGLGSRFCEAG